MAENIRDFLTENNLLMYYDRFISNGYDDMNQLLNVTLSEHEEVCKDLDFFLYNWSSKTIPHCYQDSIIKTKKPVSYIYFSTTYYGEGNILRVHVYSLQYIFVFFIQVICVDNYLTQGNGMVGLKGKEVTGGSQWIYYWGVFNRKSPIQCVNWNKAKTFIIDFNLSD